jgi:deazaflavin-dependent oxidoreductase (nitroreductase family)
VTTTKDRLLTVISKYGARMHVTMARRSGGRLVRTFRGGDVLLLTHTGRTSGRTYTTPALYVRDGEDYVVAASNGGIDREPQWWLNLQADPRGAVEIGGRRTDVVASTVGDRDRQRLWDALMAKCPTYDDYQASVSRRISLVRLSPVAEEQAA